jgi:ATP-binding cassette subfamily B (MDR/TAP) protein 1
MKTEGL